MKRNAFIFEGKKFKVVAFFFRDFCFLFMSPSSSITVMSSAFISLTLLPSTLLIFLYHYLMMHSKWAGLLCAREKESDGECAFQSFSASIFKIQNCWLEIEVAY